MNTKRNLAQWLEAVSVHPPGYSDHCPDWFGVSVDHEGGFIAYFRDESDALSYRLDYINRQMNPVKLAPLPYQ